MIVRTVHGAGDPPVAPVYVAARLFVHLRHLGEDPLRVLPARRKGEVTGDACALGYHLLLDVQTRLAELLVDFLLGRREAQREQDRLLHTCARK